MKAVILAAGSGTRFQRENVEVPKPLIKVGGLSVLERAARSCVKAGVSEVIIVTGAQGDVVKSALSNRLSALPIRWVQNDNWPNGNGTSVLAARPFVSEEHALVLMADHIIFPHTLKRLISQPVSPAITLLGIDRKYALLSDVDDATKVRLSGDRVTEISKALNPFDAVDFGAAVCSPRFFESLAQAAKEQNGACAHTDGMRRAAQEGNLAAFDIGADRWEDADNKLSLKAAEAVLFNSLRKPTDGFMSRYLERRLSLSITRLLANTNITPNHMTLAVIAIGAGAAVLFAQPGYWPKVAGAFVFWCASFLDGCDGELARLKFLESRWGGWLDLWGDNVVHMLVFAGLGFGLAQDTGENYWRLLGAVAAAGVLASVSWVSWTTMRRKKASQPFFTSTAAESDRERSPVWARRLTALADALSRRDFIFVTIFLALFGWLEYFLWAAAIGSHMYWIVLLVGSWARRVRSSVTSLALLAMLSAISFAVEAKDDGLDVSDFLDKAYGFLPVMAPITEPAVGYGGMGGLLFIDRDKSPKEHQEGFGRPNLSMVGGLGTENGTWGAFGVDSRHWMNDQLQTLAGGIYSSVNLDYHGVGEDSQLKDHPLRYNLEPKGGALHVKHRIVRSRLMLGLGYVYMSTHVTFDAPDAGASTPLNHKESKVGGTMLSSTYDSRDTIFTPRKGTYADISGNIFSPALGGDDNCQRVTPTLIQYVPLRDDLTFGVNAAATFSFGDMPFYMLPYISLRGIPSMRYQGEEAAQIEGELRWQFWKRWSLVVFGGGGTAWNNFEHTDNKVTAVSGGGGFRYEIARRYKLHMGIDAAAGPAGPAVYVQMGSAWARP